MSPADTFPAPSWFEVACDRLRNASIPGATLLLEHDEQLRLLVAFWPEAAPALGHVDHEYASPELAAEAEMRTLRSLAWNATGFDRPEAIGRLRAILGEAFPVAAKMAQAIAAGLVLPDGTVHGQADTYIQLKTAQSIKGAAGRTR